MVKYKDYIKEVYGGSKWRAELLVKENLIKPEQQEIFEGMFRAAMVTIVENLGFDKQIGTENGKT